MLVFRKTMEAAVEAEKRSARERLSELARCYGDALNRVTALQQQLSAWVLNEPRNITPQQMAQMFYAQDDSWQAEFFNCMQSEVLAHHAAQPPARPGEFTPSPGVPAGEAQWCWMAGHLTDEGFETIEAMYDHAKYHREKSEVAA